MVMKKCKKCGINKKLSEFHKDRSCRDGLRRWCKCCGNKNSIEWHRNNPQKAREKNIKWRNNNKKHVNKYLKERKELNPELKLRSNLRSRLYSALKNNHKKGKTFDYLGCTIEEFKIYLESKFNAGMSWDNYGKGGWDIDHILPCASFDHSSEEQIKKCWHYTNMQPMWHIDNIQKSNRIISGDAHE